MLAHQIGPGPEDAMEVGSPRQRLRHRHRGPHLVEARIIGLAAEDRDPRCDWSRRRSGSAPACDAPDDACACAPRTRKAAARNGSGSGKARSREIPSPSPAISRWPGVSRTMPKTIADTSATGAHMPGGEHRMRIAMMPVSAATSTKVCKDVTQESVNRVFDEGPREQTEGKHQREAAASTKP